MTLFIQVLIVVLLIAGIAVAGRLFYILGDVHRTIKGVEETRLEVNATLKPSRSSPQRMARFVSVRTPETPCDCSVTPSP